MAPCLCVVLVFKECVVEATDRTPTLLVCVQQVMINRCSWWHSYLIVRGEMLGWVSRRTPRKQWPRTF